ncbi:Hpt domain-containing protein [Granulicella pectinivorans]|uniref:Hpt domain-containing protein n=2 Tax=Granulicella pectinivorans TaxID=474950 RepID=A0A1I6LY26_9BACT|nr:Hpt domain-containing protein [Granulicella pectinivorans]
MVANRSEIMERMRTAFRAEALDLLPELDGALLAMEMEPQNTALVHRAFRAMHTIKGSGATAGFAHLARFAHGVEEAFDLARAGKLAITSELIDCGLKACDVIREILDMEDDEREASGERSVSEAVLRLLPAAGQATRHELPAASSATVPIAYEILFKPHVDLFRSGTDPLSLLDELRDFGATRVKAHFDALPPLAEFDPEGCYLWWHVLLITERSAEAIRDVFVFVEDDCRIEIRVLPRQSESIAFLMLPRADQAAAWQRLQHAYLAVAEASLRQMKSSSANAPDEIRAYLDAMHHLAAVALCGQSFVAAECAQAQARILERMLRVGRPMSAQDGVRLQQALAVLHQQGSRKESHA